jgi:VanZ family protein
MHPSDSGAPKGRIGAFMPPLTALLHGSQQRTPWRLLLALLLLVISWLAFLPEAPTPDFEGADKINHLLAFATLAVVAGLALAPGWLNAGWVALGLLCYGGFIEVVQTYLPPRVGDWADLLADGIGMAAGLLLLALLRRRWHPDLQRR